MPLKVPSEAPGRKLPAGTISKLSGFYFCVETKEENPEPRFHASLLCIKKPFMNSCQGGKESKRIRVDMPLV